MGDVIFVSQDVFDEMMQYYSEDNISYSDFLMLDYRQINTENASLYDGYMEQFKDADKLYNDNIRDTLERFFTQQKTAYEIAQCLVGSEMCIRDRFTGT